MQTLAGRDGPAGEAYDEFRLGNTFADAYHMSAAQEKRDWAFWNVFASGWYAGHNRTEFRAAEVERKVDWEPKDEEVLAACKPGPIEYEAIPREDARFHDFSDEEVRAWAVEQVIRAGAMPLTIVEQAKTLVGYMRPVEGPQPPDHDPDFDEVVETIPEEEAWMHFTKRQNHDIPSHRNVFKAGYIAGFTEATKPEYRDKIDVTIPSIEIPITDEMRNVGAEVISPPGLSYRQKANACFVAMLRRAIAEVRVDTNGTRGTLRVQISTGTRAIADDAAEEAPRTLGDLDPPPSPYIRDTMGEIIGTKKPYAKPEVVKHGQAAGYGKLIRTPEPRWPHMEDAGLAALAKVQTENGYTPYPHGQMREIIRTVWHEMTRAREG